MNYFAHAHLAAQRRADPYFVLGAMLPDWTGWVGDRLGEVRHPGLAAGVRFHHETDAAFHASACFNRWVREATDDLGSAGLERGPSRGAAHVGVELLLDGVLVGEAGAIRAYADALALAHSVSSDLVWGRDASRLRYEEVVRRLAASDLPAAYANPDRVAEATVRTLERRPRLRVPKHLTSRIADWAGPARHRLICDAPTLLLETESGLDPGAAP